MSEAKAVRMVFGTFFEWCLGHLGRGKIKGMAWQHSMCKSTHQARTSQRRPWPTRTMLLGLQGSGFDGGFGFESSRHLCWSGAQGVESLGCCVGLCRCVYIHTYIQLYIYIYNIHIYIYIYICMYVCMHTCMYVCLLKCVYIYTYTSPICQLLVCSNTRHENNRWLKL